MRLFSKMTNFAPPLPLYPIPKVNAFCNKTQTDTLTYINTHGYSHSFTRRSCASTSLRKWWHISGDFKHSGWFLTYFSVVFFCHRLTCKTCSPQWCFDNQIIMSSVVEPHPSWKRMIFDLFWSLTRLWSALCRYSDKGRCSRPYLYIFFNTSEKTLWLLLFFYV